LKLVDREKRRKVTVWIVLVLLLLAWALLKYLSATTPL
jgi:hypothetical protein